MFCEAFVVVTLFSNTPKAIREIVPEVLEWIPDLYLTLALHLGLMNVGWNLGLVRD